MLQLDDQIDGKKVEYVWTTNCYEPQPLRILLFIIRGTAVRLRDYSGMVLSHKPHLLRHSRGFGTD